MNTDDIDDGPGPKALMIWGVIGFGAVSDILHGRVHPMWAAIVGVGVFVALYVGGLWFAFNRPPWHRLPLTLAALAFLDAVVLTLWFGHGMPGLFPASAIVIGAVIPWGGKRPWPPFVLLPACLLGGLATYLQSHEVGTSLAIFYGSLISGFVVATMLRLFSAIRELRETREELARTAVSEERLRFARDLHDLLGHTLSVMVVKAQAVRRIAPRDGEIAAEQAADIETIGRDALRQVRLAVTGYRGRGLDAEIDGARTALRDAGIEAVINRRGEALPDEADALLGWAVREGVTNVIRHSGADRCEITLSNEGDRAILTVRDNGTGGPAPQGNGLRGLTERVGDGTLEAGPGPDGGYRLSVTLPLTREVEVS